MTILLMLLRLFWGNIFNLRRLQAKTKVQTDVLDGLLYGDNIDRNTSSEAKMQITLDQVSQSCDNYDLTISTNETEVIHQPALKNVQWTNHHCEWTKTESC